MAQRPGSHRADHASPLVDLDVVFADDRLIDSIAGADPASPAPRAPRQVDRAAGPAGRHSAGRQPAAPLGHGRHTVHTKHSGHPVVGIADRPDGADALTELFQTWRYELASEPLPPVPSVHRAADAVVSGVEVRRRSLRPAVSIAAAIAALLIGSATVGSKDADQDSALWGITQVLWPDRAVSVASRDHVREALDQATEALAAGDAQQAQLALLRAAVELGRVADVDGKGGMQQQVDELWRRAAPRELSGTSLTADPMTEQMLADGLLASGHAPVTSASTSAARRTASSPPVDPTAVAAPTTGEDLADRAAPGTVLARPSEPGTLVGSPAAAATSGPASGNGPTGGGGVSSVGTAVAAPTVGPSAPPASLPASNPPSSVSSAPPTPPASPATATPGTPTPPVAVEPPPGTPAESVSPMTSMIGTTAPAPAPAPTTTGTDPTGSTPVTTTLTGSGGPEPLLQPKARVSTAG